MRSNRQALWIALLTAAACLLLLLPYWPSLRGFFANDDWVIVYYYGRISPAQFWQYFSPRVIWFYRPLQSVEFGLLYHQFGLDPVPYNAALFAMHLAVCALAYRWLRELTGRPAQAAVATILFAAQWTYVDVLVWKANFNTIQWAGTTVAIALASLLYLRTGKRRWWWAAVALCTVNFFTKEMAVNAPVLLFVQWLCVEVRGHHLRRDRFARLARRAIDVCGVPSLLVLVYVAAHQLFIRDLYAEQKPGYFFVGPLQAVKQCLFVYNHALLSFKEDPLLLGRAPLLKAWIDAFAQYALVLPPLLLLLAWRWKDRALLLGTGWLLGSYLPCVFLRDYHASRFYYLPALGAALILTRLLARGWEVGTRALSTEGAHRFAPAALLRPAMVVLAAYLVLANAANVARYVQVDQKGSRAAESAYELLRSHRGVVPPGSLVVLRQPPPGYFGNGLGAREMAKLALDDPTVEAVMEGQNMEPRRLAQLQRIPNVFLVDMREEVLRLQPVRSEHPRHASR